jgi:tetratricopeptide (TPR) repeat protein
MVAGVSRYAANARARARYVEGLQLLRAGDDADAVALWEALRSDTSSFPDVYTQLAKYYDDAQDDPQHAIAVLDSMRKHGLDTPEMHIQLAEAYVKVKDTRAVTEGKAAVLAAPTSWRAHMALMAAYGYAYDSTDAIAELNAAERLAKPNAAMFLEGAEYGASSYNYPVAQDQANRCIAIEPTNAEAWYVLGLSVASRPTPKHLAEAVSDFQMSIQLKPQIYLSQMELGNVYLQLGSLVLAQHYLERARILNDAMPPGGSVPIQTMQDRTRIDHFLMEVYQKQHDPIDAEIMRLEDNAINMRIQKSLQAGQLGGSSR